MKDRQSAAKGPQQRIPFISAILHWLAMPVIVLLRSRFGFSFLSPKAVFLSFAWAHLLFFIYAWLEPGVWRWAGPTASFALGTSVLYLIHLIVAAGHETRRSGEHDHHSGTSHLMRLLGGLPEEVYERVERRMHLFVEPLLVLIAALILRGTMLGDWLLMIAPALCLKEFLNYWYEIRHEKKETDIADDARKKIRRQSSDTSVPLPSAGGRKPKMTRKGRSAGSATASEREHQFAEVLRLMPPYELQQAEANYRQLIKQVHPDQGKSGDEGRAALLNEAIEYFRSTLR